MSHIQSTDSYQSSLLETAPVFDHKQGPSQTLFTRTKAISVNSSGAQFTIYPKSNTTLLDRRFYLEIEMEISGAGPADPVGAPRAFPLNSIIRNCQLTINGEQISSQPSDLIYPLQRFIGYDDYTSSYYGMTPTQLDPAGNLAATPPTSGFQAQSTLPFAVARAGGNVSGTFYAVDNPNSPFITTISSSSRDLEIPRAAFPYTNGTNKFTYVFVEPLIHPALAEADDQSAFVNINAIDLQLGFHSDLYKRVWSNIVDDAGSVNITANAYLWTRQMTASVQSIPAVVRYEMPKYRITNQQLGSLALNASVGSTMSNLIYTTIPSFLYVYARIRDNTQRNDDGIGFLRMDNISITAGTRSGMLASCNTQMLFALSKDNGLKQLNYYHWSTTLGSVLCIDCAKDLGLSPGSKRQLTLDITANFTNTSYDTRAFDMYVTAVIPGMLEITTDAAKVTEGYSLESEYEAAETSESSNLVPMVTPKTDGNGFHSHGGKFNLGKLLSVGKSVLGTAVPLMNQFAPALAALPGGAQLITAANVANKVAGNGYDKRKLISHGGGKMFG